MLVPKFVGPVQPNYNLNNPKSSPGEDWNLEVTSQQQENHFIYTG